MCIEKPLELQGRNPTKPVIVGDVSTLSPGLIDQADQKLVCTYTHRHAYEYTQMGEGWWQEKDCK